MNKAKVENALKVAKAFIASVDTLNASEVDRKAIYSTPYETDYYYYSSPKHRGAVKRASMDLTRALADMRNSKVR